MTIKKGRDQRDPKVKFNQHDTVNSGFVKPIVTGQCADVLGLIRQYQPLLSFILTADHAIPEAAARVHEFRAKGYHIITRIIPEVEFRGRIRRNAAMYSLGVPEWPYPGFLAGEEGSDANRRA